MLNPIEETFRTLSNYVVFNSEQCSQEERLFVINNLFNPRFLSPVVIAYESQVRKIGNTHGFIIPTVLASYLKINPGDEIQLIIKNLENRPYTPPTTEEIEKVYKNYEYYFRFPRGVTLTYFNFNMVNKKFFIPIHTLLRQTGSSYAFFVALTVLELFGHRPNDKVSLYIRKVNS